jgi:hypothetical protein
MKECNRKECVMYNEKCERNCNHDNKRVVTYDANCPGFELDN